MDWKLARYGEPWVVGDTLNSGIGQGFVLASPLQLAVMTARIASGNIVVPRLIRTRNGIEDPLPDPQPLGLGPNNLRGVRDGMIAVSNSTRGTAYRARIVAEDMRMAGKSGTSQVRNITAAERARGVTSNADLPWERRDHGLFVAFAPVEAPRLACAVVVEHGSGGSSAAAPIVRDVLLRALYGEVPPLTAYPAEQRGKIEELFQSMVLRDLSQPTSGRTRA
jgi:penicillin-binding protein 2